MVWKKVVCCVIMLLTLTGCGGKNREPAQKALDLRTALLDAGGCEFTADVEADFGDRVYSFSVFCNYTAGEKAVISVTKPEEIAGITATVSDSGAKVDFDGIALDFGTLAGGRTSAMEAPWLLGKCWSGAYISSAGADGELQRITYLEGYGEGELTVDTWLDSAGSPVRGEIAYDGVRCLTLDISQFQLKT